MRWTTGGRKMLKPRQRLKELRERAGMTGDEVAKEVNYSGRNAYLKYEQEKQQGDRKIPNHVISRLLPVFVGKGSPPITVDDLLAISDKPTTAHRLSSLFKQLESDPAARPTPEVQRPIIHKLPIKYRVEEGVFLSQSRVDSMSEGHAPIVSSEDVSGEQFAVLVLDTRWPEFPSGAYLHCTAEVVAGKKVVASVKVAGNSGIFALTICDYAGNGTLTSTDGKRMDGTVLGTVVGMYRRF